MYKELYEAWRREKESMEIQELPDDFYVKVAGYIKKLREESRMLDEKSVKAKILRRKTGNVEAMVRELLQLRLEKIVRKALKGEKVSDMVLVQEEQPWNRKLASLVEEFQSFSNELLRGRLAKALEEKPKTVVVRFLKDVPAIVGADMKTYGPFMAEDVATLPFENAEVFIRRGVAEKVEISS